MARTLEARSEARLVALAEAEAALATAWATKPLLPAKDALQVLAADVPRLWHAETISHRDRKRLLRTLVADVTLLPQPDPDTVRVGVRWHTGATDELTVPRPGPGRTPAAAVELMRRHGATHTSAQLADLLNAAGLRTGKGKPYTERNVASIRNVYKIYGPRTAGPSPLTTARSASTGRRRTRHPRRRGLQLAWLTGRYRLGGSQRTLVHPLGPCPRRRSTGGRSRTRSGSSRPSRHGSQQPTAEPHERTDHRVLSVTMVNR